MHQQPLGFALDLAAPNSPPATVSFLGSASFSTHADPGAAAATLGPALQSATFTVLQEKLQGYQVALPTLASSLPHFTAEIAARASGLAAPGTTVHALTLDASVPQSAVAPAAGQVMTGSQIAANVAGNFANNAMSAAVASVPRPHVQANVAGFRINLGGNESVGDQVKDEIKERLLMYAIVGGVLVLLSGICVVTLAMKLLF